MIIITNKTIENDKIVEVEYNLKSSNSLTYGKKDCLLNVDDDLELYVMENLTEDEEGLIQEILEQWRNSFKADLYKIKIILDQMDDLDAIETIIASQPKGVQLAW